MNLLAPAWSSCYPNAFLLPEKIRGVLLAAYLVRLTLLPHIPSSEIGCYGPWLRFRTCTSRLLLSYFVHTSKAVKQCIDVYDSHWPPQIGLQTHEIRQFQGSHEMVGVRLGVRLHIRATFKNRLLLRILQSLSAIYELSIMWVA